MSQLEIDDPHALFGMAVAHLDDVDTSGPGGSTAWMDVEVRPQAALTRHR